MTSRSCSVAGICALAFAVAPVTGVLAASSSARPATRSERSAIVKAFAASDGSASQVHGVYLSRSNSSLAVVCVRTPESGIKAYVFGRAGRSWRNVAGGSVGQAGNSADRRLERACG